MASRELYYNFVAWCLSGRTITEKNVMQMDVLSKIVTAEKLATRLDKVRTSGGKVVFTNGCFDILHMGHVTYLEAARKEGDCLVLGLNSDSSKPSRAAMSSRVRFLCFSSL